MEFSAKQIAEFLQGEIVGNADACVSTFAKIEEGTPGALSFLSNPKYTSYIYTTQSSVVLVNKDFVPEQPISATLIKVDNAYESLAKLLSLYESMKPKRTGISDLAFVSPSAKIGDNVYLAPFAVVEDNAVIGDGVHLYPHATVGSGAHIGEGTVLHSNVVVYHDCRVGKNCILHSGCVIGADGFGFAPSPTGYEKIPQIGIVMIEDDVEIGANTCVDRATMGATIIHKGVKLDNLIQIAHNDEIGSHTVMAAQVGVAGSTKIGEWCMFGGQVGIVGHCKIGDRTLCGAQAGIGGSLPKGNVKIQGSPAIDAKNFARSSVVFKKLPDMYQQLNALQKKIEQLEQELAAKQ